MMKEMDEKVVIPRPSRLFYFHVLILKYLSLSVSLTGVSTIMFPCQGIGMSNKNESTKGHNLSPDINNHWFVEFDYTYSQIENKV